MRIRSCGRLSLAAPLAVALCLAPATAQAQGPNLGQSPAPSPAAPTSPAPSPEETPATTPDEPNANADQSDAEPLEIIEPPARNGAKPSKSDRQQARDAAIASAKARESARLAVTEARGAYERALAKHRVAKFQVQQLLHRSQRSAQRAADLRRDMGNLARMAYSSGNSDVNLLAVLLDADSPEELMAGAEAATRIVGHKETQWNDATQSQARADDLAVQARLLTEQTARDLAAAKDELDKMISLAKAVDLAIEPPRHVPPVDLTTTSDWVFPTATGKIDSNAGMRMHPILHYMRCHAGADISAPGGTAIYAVDDGVVLSADVNGGYGNFTLIAHGNGLTSAYAHQQVILVQPGDRVTRGQLIGEVGTTGLSTGPHLHFEASYHGVPYNPRGWLEDHPEMRTPAC